MQKHPASDTHVSNSAVFGHGLRSRCLGNQWRSNVQGHPVKTSAAGAHNLLAVLVVQHCGKLLFQLPPNASTAQAIAYLWIHSTPTLQWNRTGWHPLICKAPGCELYTKYSFCSAVPGTRLPIWLVQTNGIAHLKSIALRHPPQESDTAIKSSLVVLEICWSRLQLDLRALLQHFGFYPPTCLKTSHLLAITRVYLQAACDYVPNHLTADMK